MPIKPPTFEGSGGFAEIAPGIVVDQFGTMYRYVRTENPEVAGLPTLPPGVPRYITTMEEITGAERKRILAVLGLTEANVSDLAGGSGTSSAQFDQSFAEDRRRFDLEFNQKVKADADALQFNYAQLNQQEKDSLRQLAYAYYNAGLDANAARMQALAQLKAAQTQGAVNLAQVALNGAETMSRFSANPRDAVAELEYRNLIGTPAPFATTQGAAFNQYQAALGDKTAGLAKQIQDALGNASRYVNAPIPDEYMQPVPPPPPVDMTPQVYAPPQLSLGPLTDQEAANLRAFAAAAPPQGYTPEEQEALANIARVQQAVASGQSEALLAWLRAAGAAKGKTINLQHPVVVMDAVTGGLVATGAENPGGEKLKKTAKGIEFIPKRGVSKKLDPKRQMEIVTMATRHIPQLRIPGYAAGGDMDLGEFLRHYAASDKATRAAYDWLARESNLRGQVLGDIKGGTTGKERGAAEASKVYVIKTVDPTTGRVTYQVTAAVDPRNGGMLAEVVNGRTVERPLTPADVQEINATNKRRLLSHVRQSSSKRGPIPAAETARDPGVNWIIDAYMDTGSTPLFGLHPDTGKVLTEQDYRNLIRSGRRPAPYRVGERTGYRPPPLDGAPVYPGFAGGGRAMSIWGRRPYGRNAQWLAQANQTQAGIRNPSNIPMGDINRDQVVNVADQLIQPALATAIGQKRYIRNLDLNGDGVVNVADQLIATLRARGVPGYASGGTVMPASSEGGTNMNIHEAFKVVGVESGHTYAVGAEDRPMQLVIKPLPSVEKARKEQQKMQQQLMQGMAQGGSIAAPDFLEQLRRRLRQMDPQITTTGNQQLPDLRLLAGIYPTLLADKDLGDYVRAGYSKIGVSNPTFDYTIQQYRPEEIRLGVPRWI